MLALTNMHITVPEAVRTGDSVTLSCDYDLDSDALYTIKWFRNEEEFYRYVPKETPPSQTFHVPHLTVNVSKCRCSNNIVIKEEAFPITLYISVYFFYEKIFKN